MAAIGTFSTMFPPAPTFTADNVGSLIGKVCIVTGSTTGIGFELVKILYAKGATVYVGGRSIAKITEAIRQIEKDVSAHSGQLKPFCVDLADLAQVKPIVEGFLAAESRLDLLVHNAGVMMAPAGSTSEQGHDLEMGTNCLSPYLLTQLLRDILVQTAAKEPNYAVRVVFVVSAIHFGNLEEAVEFDATGTPQRLPKPMDSYMQTKRGGQLLVLDVANQLGESGVLSVGVHPGLIRTQLQRHNSPVPGFFFDIFFTKPALYGAYSELFAALSPSLSNPEHNGAYVLAWGRIAARPNVIEKAVKSGLAGKFIDFCDRETKAFT